MAVDGDSHAMAVVDYVAISVLIVGLVYFVGTGAPTLKRLRRMSALHPKADIRQSVRHVRFVPKADIEPASLLKADVIERRRAANGGQESTVT